MIFRKNEIKMRWNKFVTILAHDKLHKLILILKLLTILNISKSINKTNI